MVTLGRTRKVIPGGGGGGGGGAAGGAEGAPARVFDMLQYFETSLPSVEHLV